MARVVRFALVIVLSSSTISGAREASAQHFGRNKVEYVNFEFKVFETEHFAVYHYSSEEASARLASRLAERWYARLSRVLEHTLETRQPLILYGSQPEFAQTNVVAGFLGEGIGGVTESARRRIVMPFAPTLAETDRILGHEIVHAFQFDMMRRYGGSLGWPLWAVEGMAQYLSLGATDPEAAMWLRDAVTSGLLPERHQEAARKFSPYRYGHALWAYLAGRFGDRVIQDVLKARRSGSLERRIHKVTGVELKQLFTDWRTAAHDRYGSPSVVNGESWSRLLRGPQTGRLYLGPSLSPNGREAVFFSEKDRLSLDLFLADTKTGAVTRKLATMAATARFESLQAIRSAGSWSSVGDRFAFAAIERGQPALIVLDMRRAGQEQVVRLPQLGQILSPSWSPDGGAVAFSAIEGGVTDLYVYDLKSARLRQLTNDAFADLQPAWSPDGRQIAFATDRFSSNLASLSFGPCELAIADVDSGEVRPLRAIEGAKHLNPQWSGDGKSLYFISDPKGISNVYRLEIAPGTLYQITDVAGGVTGLAPMSPALSVARDAPVLTFTVYHAGKYAMEIRRGVGALTGDRTLEGPEKPATITLPPAERVESSVEQLLRDQYFGLPEASTLDARPYSPDLFVEAIGPPYISSGGGPFGTFVRGGGSLLFSDLLGERKVSMYAQVGNRLRDLALGVRYLNRERRWNWGAVAEVQPSLRRLPRIHVTQQDGQPAVNSEARYFERTQVRFAGYAAYPMSQTRRLEFEAGIRHASYRRTVHSTIRSLTTGRLLGQTSATEPGGEPASVGEASAALVGDRSVFGPTSPILGSRYRFEFATAVGDLSVTRILLDHRQYLMPVKPYTLATRLVHLGQYGPDADDPRLLPTYLGSRQFVRGYGWSSLRCQLGTAGECSAFEDLLGSRLIVGNVEVRVPLMGILSRDLRYGPVPVEAFLFADSGLVWSRSPTFTAARSERRLVTSFGAGARINAFGLPLELAAVRALDSPARGWSFGFSFRPGF